MIKTTVFLVKIFKITYELNKGIISISDWKDYCIRCCLLTHWGSVTHICVGNLTIIVSDNGLSPGRGQAIIWTNAGILLFGPLGTNFREITIEILACPFKKMRLKVSSAKWWPSCFGLNVLSDGIGGCQTSENSSPSGPSTYRLLSQQSVLVDKKDNHTCGRDAPGEQLSLNCWLTWYLTMV